MKTVNVNGVKKGISRLVFGTSHVGMLDERRRRALFDAMIEAGGDAFDTARAYGPSERLIGDWLKQSGKRDECVVITKGPTRKEGLHDVNLLAAEIDKSIEELKSAPDIFLLHGDDPSLPVEPTVDAMNAFMKAGKFKAYGAANWRPERMRAAIEYATKSEQTPFALWSVNFGLAPFTAPPAIPLLSISGKNHEGDRQWLRESGLPLLAWSPLGMGTIAQSAQSAAQSPIGAALSKPRQVLFAHQNNGLIVKKAGEIAQAKGVTVSQIGLAYVLSRFANSMAVVGSSNPEHLKENFNAVNVTLTAEEIKALEEAAAD